MLAEPVAPLPGKGFQLRVLVLRLVLLHQRGGAGQRGEQLIQVACTQQPLACRRMLHTWKKCTDLSTTPSAHGREAQIRQVMLQIHGRQV